MVEHEEEIMVAAKGVIPRRPIHQHRRNVKHTGLGLRNLLLIGADHALRVDHRFWKLGGAAGEEEFHHGVAVRGLHGGLYSGSHWRG